MFKVTNNLSQILLKNPGDVLLRIVDTGEEILVHNTILSVASETLSGALASGSSRGGPLLLPVDGNLESWMTILAHLYPTVRPRPSLSSDAIGGILPLVHKYDIACLLVDCLAYLKSALPDRLSPQISSPDYVIKWLKLADDLQLDDLRTMCMKKTWEMARNSQLGEAIMYLDQLKAKPEPSMCGNSHLSHNKVRFSTCCFNPNDFRYDFGRGRPIGSAHTFSGPHKVNDTVKGLSRDTLEELLASVVAACECKYMA